MSSDRTTKNVLINEPGVARRRGRARVKWYKEVQGILTEAGIKNCKEIAEERKR